MSVTAETVCVLTGDIVKSAALKADQLDTVMDALQESATTIAGWQADTAVRYERFRGDGWQMALVEPKWALRASLFARAAIRRACATSETRLSIGLGAAEFGSSLARSSGAAFERSGRGLERLRTHQFWAIDGDFAGIAERALAQGLFSVCDERSRHWTVRQADIFLRLAGPAPPAMIDAAESLQIQPQTVQTHFARAGGYALLDAIAAFETIWIE